ncbi:Hypothetical protein TFLO_834 [Trichococcus flocculiformis]|uniref:Uncharacterized protein n=1 Tax=Trichococcus flocculiformis TaxID=82803 RepID=A0AB38BGA5_9LACT|nr:Hypothetical protein TFLO_834 [Trichococcus flocculiformis]CZR08581.1 Hypothetical protein TES5_2583 [Trichococcus sp. ES5]SFH64064.1 hypothetical protein SAMN04488507_1006101 [Trichococcus flocculiformis]SHG05946.1 hypothetical protein SAMN04488048_12434 [Trichococcus flocculiformis]
MIEHPTFFCPKTDMQQFIQSICKNSRMREMNHNAYGYFLHFCPILLNMHYPATNFKL